MRIKTNIVLVISILLSLFLVNAGHASSPGLNFIVRGNLQDNNIVPPYSDDLNFSNLCLIDVVSNIDLDWGDNGPYNCPNDWFTTYFYGVVRAPISGTVYFFNQSDDGFFMSINDQVVISDWEDQATDSPNGLGNFVMTKDQTYVIKIWHYERGGGAAVRLFWNSVNDFSSSVIVPSSCFSTDGNAWVGSCSLAVATPPLINSLTVTVGTTLGGTATTILGSNLSGISNVKVGGINANFSNNTSNSVSIITPSGSPGVKDVSITASGGTATKTAAFTYCEFKGNSIIAKNTLGSSKSSSPAFTQSQGAGACQNASIR